MSKKPSVIIASGKCSASKKTFGLRLEEVKLKNWSITWSFPIKEKSAEREGYKENKVSGEFFYSEEFLGCPYCESRDMFVCNCGKVACHNGRKKLVVCPWCNTGGEIQGLATSLNGGNDA